MRFLLLLLAFTLHTAAADPLDHWPHWRGPILTGEAPKAEPPIEWSEAKNLRWKTEIPGQGHSSPIIWGERIFLTAAVPYGDPLPEPIWSAMPGAHNNVPVTHHHQFLVLCLNRADGRILWQKTVRQALPPEGGHESGTLANNSPVTDGERVYAFFGSMGLFCLDFEGNLLWEKDFGILKNKHGHGEGSSPVLHGDTIVINWDQEGLSFLAALNKRTGEPLWRALRNEHTSWASPVVTEHAGRVQVVVSGTNRVRGYDLATGDVIWECGGLSSNIVATPIAANGMVWAGSSYEFKAMVALRLDGATGDLTGKERVAWTRNNRTPYVPSPLLYDGHLYFLSHYQGVLTRLEAVNGEEPTGPFRLEGLQDLYASPVAAAGRIYFTDRSGVVLVMSAAAEPEMLGHNQLEDRFSATPALAGKELFLRGERYLYAISAPQ